MEKENLKGRYIKALVDYPNLGSVKKGEIGLITTDNVGITAKFPSQDPKI